MARGPLRHAGPFGIAARKLAVWISGAESDISTSPTLTAGAGAPTASEPQGSAYLRNDGAAATTLYVATDSAGTWTNAITTAAIADTNTYYTTDTIDGALDALALQVGGATDATYNFTEANVCVDDEAVYASLEKLDLKWGDLASTANGEGASLVGLEDAAASLVAANVEAAIAELATPLTLTVGAEAADVIAVTVAGPAQVAQYHARLYEATMIEALAAAATMAETGVGAEVSTTAQAALVFTTDASGAATLSITDVAGASSKTFYLEVTPASASAGAKAGPSALVAVTFDGA